MRKWTFLFFSFFLCGSTAKVDRRGDTLTGRSCCQVQHPLRSKQTHVCSPLGKCDSPAPLLRAEATGSRHQATITMRKKKQKTPQKTNNNNREYFMRVTRTSSASILSPSLYFHLAADKQQQQQKKNPASRCPPRVVAIRVVQKKKNPENAG